LLQEFFNYYNCDQMGTKVEMPKIWTQWN
jgi:hypothetical protein